MAPAPLSQVDYNEIGQVLNKHLQDTDSVNFVQKITYTYNERAWAAELEPRLLALQLQYHWARRKIDLRDSVLTTMKYQEVINLGSDSGSGAE